VATASDIHLSSLEFSVKCKYNFKPGSYCVCFTRIY